MTPLEAYIDTLTRKDTTMTKTVTPDLLPDDLLNDPATVVLHHFEHRRTERMNAASTLMLVEAINALTEEVSGLREDMADGA